MAAAVYSEVLFRTSGLHKGDTFLEQQFWLYCYSLSFALTGHLSTRPGYGLSQFASDFQSELVTAQQLCNLRQGQYGYYLTNRGT